MAGTNAIIIIIMTPETNLSDCVDLQPTLLDLFDQLIFICFGVLFIQLAVQQTAQI